ncbi:hypothetical protein IWQ60_003706 [Tieghemiomyces parasiticus]|uniref:Uncharacterized protein n=1 Tax=Tieghemiomyces parasiticus TaxID=78921 RepID=A0A9W8DZT1_9FUNG|nr:hypothetical protein IWQ60_003706 [Tieghemiomyces parasiticus]
MRPLTIVQRDRLTSRLFMLCAAGCVFTVAAPTLFPCPALEKKKQRQLNEQQALATHDNFYAKRTPVPGRPSGTVVTSE